MSSQPPPRHQAGGDATSSGPHAHLASRLGRLALLKRRFDDCGSAAELLAVASSVGPGLCGFERGLVLSVVDGHLSSNGMHALDDPGSDALRHRCQLEPIALLPESEEAALIRVAQGGASGPVPSSSVLARSLGLQRYAFAAVVPETDVLALVVFDRPGPAVTDDDRAAVQGFAYLLGLAVVAVVLRLRIRKLAFEVRDLSGSANALVKEAHVAPIALARDLDEPLRFTARTSGVG